MSASDRLVHAEQLRLVYDQTWTAVGGVGPLSLVFASFGVALIVRNGIALAFGLGPRLYTATRSRSRWCCSTIRSCW